MGRRRTDGNREQTDSKLDAERTQTNQELLERSNALGEDADNVIGRARERAKAVLELARQRADRSIAVSAAGPDAVAALASERARADEALDHEHAVADVTRGDERAQRLHALLQLLAFEREATDVALAGERRAADHMLAMRDDVLTGVAHDVRGHLNILLLNTSSIIVMRSSDRDVVLLADAMMRSVAHMNNLLADLLDAATMDSGLLRIQPTRTDVVSLVRTAVKLNAPVAEARAIVLTIEAPVEPVELDVDPPRITRVVMNLLSNALKFMPGGGRITVSVTPGPGEVGLAVSDTGPGIPPDQLEAIFDRFRQTDAASRSPGHGLGLHIARAIVNAHGGRIWAENNAHEGATFRVQLPVAALPARR